MQNSHNNNDPIIHNQRVMHQSGRYLGSNWYDLMRVDGRCDGRVTIAGMLAVKGTGKIAGRMLSNEEGGVWLAHQPREIEGGVHPGFESDRTYSPHRQRILL